MLSERTRRDLLRSLLDAADTFVKGAEQGDAAATARALAAAQEVHRQCHGGYVISEINSAFDGVFDALSEFARTGFGEVEKKKLRKAMLQARPLIVGAIANGTRSRTTDLGGGVHRIVAGEPARDVIEVEIKSMTATLGSKLTAALLQVLAGTNRVAAMLDFIRINGASHPEDSSIRERNFHVGALMTLAYLKELSRAIDALAGAGIKRELADLAPWVELQNIRRIWEREPHSKIRNAVMFHLGDLEETVPKLEEFAKDDERLPIAQNDVESVGIGSYYPAGETLLLNAAGVDIVDFDMIVSDAIAAYEPLLVSVFRIMNDLLRKCGARMPATQGRYTPLI